MPDQDDEGLTGFSGGTSWTPPPISGGIPSSPPPVLGTEQLQKAIDKFDQAVEKLTRLYGQASGGGLGGSTGNGGGSGFNGSSGAGFLGGKYNIGHFAEEAAGIAGLNFPLRGPMRAAYGSWGGLVNGASGYGTQQQGGGSSGFAGQYSFGGVPSGGAPGTTYSAPAASSPSAPYSPSGSAPATFNGQSMGSPGSGQPSSSGSGFLGGGGGGGFLSGGAGDMASGALSLMASFASYGKASLPIQLAMSAMQQQGNLLAPSNAQGSNQYGDAMRGAAFGSNNTNPNNFAMSAQDASAGYSILQQMAGSGLAASTSTGRFGLAGAASFAGANPGMSYASAAGMAQSMAQPSMSLAMTQAGYRTTPMKLGGGGANSFSSVIGSMMQRWYPGQQWVKPQNMSASLEQGQVGYQNLAALGYNPDQIQALSSTMEAYNQVGYRSHLSASKVQGLFQGAQSGNKSDLALLARDHVTESDLSQLKKYQAQGTMNQSDVYDSFTSGLNGATGELTKFKKILNDIENIPGLNQIIGGGGGAMATVGHFAGDFKDIGEGAFGLSMVGLGAARMSGGGSVGGLLSKLTGGKFGGILGLMDPELVATVAAGRGLSGLLGGGSTGGPSTSPGNPLGGLGGVRGANGTGRWSAETMNVTANVVYVRGPIAGESGSGTPATGGSGGGGSSSGGGGTGALGWMGSMFDRGGQALDRMVGTVGSATGGHESIAKAFLNMLFGGPGRQPGTGGGARSPSAVTPASSSRPSMTSSVSPQARTAVGDAQSQIGVPYVWGGEQPGVGFDCSGLTQWAYAQAGVRLPRTSQSQWAALKGRRSVNPKYAQEGDLVFMAGSDGTADNPGHVGLMVSSHSLIEAPYTGTDIKEIAYNPADWSHAARPVGSMGTTAASAATAAAGSGGGAAGGMTGSGGSSANSVSEAENVTGALGGGSGGIALGGGMYSASNGGSAGSTSTGGSTRVATTGGGSVTANKALAQRLMKQMYGWTGAQWTQGLLPLWTQESGFNQYAQNPTSTAYGIPQFLNDTWSAYGPKTSNPGLQEKYGLEYIHDRYRTPIAAMTHERQFNWYASGTRNARPGIAILGERGPEAMLLRGGEQIMDAGQTAKVTGAQGVAQSIWSAPGLSTGTQGNPGGVSVTLEFAPGAIVIQQGAGVNSVQAASNSAREIVSKVVEMLHDEGIYAAIRSGQKG